MTFRIRSRDPGGGRARARAPRRSSRASWPPTTCTSSTLPLFELAAELEGHPDNVGAALLGGFVICTPGEEPVRFDPVPGFEGVLVTPPEPVPTEEARAALPAEVPMADAVHNVAHAALLVLGLARGDLDLVGARPRGPDPPAAPRAPLPALDGAGAAGARASARWARRSRAPARPCCSGATGSRPGDLYERLRDECADCEVRRVQFAPGGADVRAL